MTFFRLNTLERFQEHLERNYDAYCNRHNIEKTEKQLLRYLIDNDLILGPQIQKYTVNEEFKQIYPQIEPRKTQAINHLSNRFMLSERTIYSLLKQTHAASKVPKTL